jgi:hypothetical protein
MPPQFYLPTWRLTVTQSRFWVARIGVGSEVCGNTGRAAPCCRRITTRLLPRSGINETVTSPLWKTLVEKKSIGV